MKIYAECHAYFIDLEIKSMELILFDCYGVISSFGDISKRQVVYFLYTVLTLKADHAGLLKTTCVLE